MQPDGYDLSGKVAIVTGGGEGIGAATARLLAKCGADVAIAGRTEISLARTAAEIAEATGRRCIGIVADATDETQVRELVARTAGAFGRIDILVNNVGWGDRAPLATCDTAAWHREFSRNLDAAFFCAREAFEYLKADGGGAVVSNSSVAGFDGVQGLGAYSVAKASLRMFTRVAAAEWGRHGIRVNAVAPGLIATENAMRNFAETGVDIDAVCGARALPRAGRPEEVASAIVFLASDAASYITGETLQVTGGPVMGGTIDSVD